MRVFDIGLMGTSLTNSYVSWNWPQKAIGLLSLGARGPVSVYNYAMSGGVSADGLAQAHSVADLRPKVAIVEFGMNDANLGNNVSVSTFTKNIRDSIAILRSRSPATRIYVMTMNPAIGPALSFIPSLDSYYQVLRNLAGEQAVGLIDNAPFWAAATSLDIPDGIHPTEAAITARSLPNIVAHLRPLMN